MKTHFWLWAGALSASLAALPVWAQPTASLASPQAAPPEVLAAAMGSVSLPMALQAAWQRALEARDSDGQRRRAEAERAAANGLWASSPALALSHRDDRLQSNTGRRETEIGVAVSLWLPGQKAARAETAETFAARVQAAERVARLSVAGEVRETAWLLAALQAEADQADAQSVSLKKLADDVERRVRAGDLARADALAAQAEYLAASAQRSDLDRRWRGARARWTLLTGLVAGPELSAVVAVDAGPADPSMHPELQLAHLSAELAKKRVDLLRLSSRDAPELTVGLRQDTPGRAQASQGSLLLALRVPLGSEGRNRPLEAAALAELDLAQAQLQRLRERLDSDINAARDAQQSAQTQLDAEAARARLLRERAGLIDKSFVAGESPLPELLRALAASAQADGAAARQTAALGLARARFQQTLGLLP